MGKEKNRILITMACEDLGVAPVEGSVRRTCERCQRSVWVSPASPYWHIWSLQLCCTRCRKDAPPDPDGEDMEPTDEQRVEIARATGVYGDALDRLIKDVQRYYRRGAE